MEEGEVVSVPEGRALYRRLIRMTRARSIACWEGDIEVSEMGRGEGTGVGEREGF